jgi:hypothetical protein
MERDGNRDREKKTEGMIKRRKTETETGRKTDRTKNRDRNRKKD